MHILKKKPEKEGEKMELIKVENYLQNSEPIETQGKTFEKIIFIYKMAIKEIETKIEIMQEEYKILYNYELINQIKTRIKKPESIIEKMKERGYKLTYKEMIENINDIAGVRVICPMKKDIISIRNQIKKIPGIKIIKEKDYVSKPKPSGYTSYHMILEVPVMLSQRIIYVKAEIQIRTMAMDFWANLEHKMKYKPEREISKKASKELVSYAKIINKMENKIMLLNQ